MSFKKTFPAQYRKCVQSDAFSLVCLLIQNQKINKTPISDLFQHLFVQFSLLVQTLRFFPLMPLLVTGDFKNLMFNTRRGMGLAGIQRPHPQADYSILVSLGNNQIMIYHQLFQSVYGHLMCEKRIRSIFSCKVNLKISFVSNFENKTLHPAK